jgi:CRISPR type I-D-associated protein Csc2
MTDLSPVSELLGDIDALTHEAKGGKKNYIMPALKNLGSITIPLVREVISPASFRNEQSEITDIDAAGLRRVRAVANKFKYGERARGLQILRYFEAGGAFPQNRTELPHNETAGAAFDLNTIVFGDSTDASGKVLPVKAAALYSDAVSIAPYADCVDHTFHNRASEDGTLFDAEKKENSNNLFERHFVKPGTLLIQTITINGRTAPAAAIEHLLLCIGLAGAYGGQTSINGVNVRTHIAGIFGAPLERDIASPYALLQALDGRAGAQDGPDTVQKIVGDLFASRYPKVIDAAGSAAIRDNLIARLEDDDMSMRADYVANQVKIAEFFDAWFAGIKGSKT